jgi:hypothetical protein
MMAHAVIQGSLAGTRTTGPVPARGGSAGSSGGLAAGECGLVSLIVVSSSVG